MNEEKGIIIENLCIKGNYFLIKIYAPEIAKNSKPGNFVMLGVSGTYDPLLKRPFGIFDVDETHLYLYYEIVGKGSKLLSEKNEDDSVNLIGPLGNSFPDLKDKNILMIAGGRGIAPLYYGIKKYIKGNNKVNLLYGARSKDDLNLLTQIEELDLTEKFYYTDDGSFNKKGFVTSDLKQIIAKNKIDITISCGPEAMFESLYHILKDEQTTDFFSMEAIMGCGIGICHSCVVESEDNGYKKVCSDGPIFNVSDLKW